MDMKTKPEATSATKPINKTEKTSADQSSLENEAETLSAKLAYYLPTSVESLLNARMSEAELARTLLITVSRQLFVALVSAIALGILIILFVQYIWTESSVTFPIVMLCGMVGGFVGIQRRLKDLTMEDLTLLASSRIYLLLAPSVGGVLALVLYILFLSGLLQGALFPVFKSDVPESEQAALGFFTIFHQHATNGFAGYAKLMFWSFVAGFSERFVTDVIGKFEGSAVKSIELKRERSQDSVVSTERRETTDGESSKKTAGAKGDKP